MKKLFLLFLLIGCTNLFAQQKWTTNNKQTLTAGPTQMSFINENEGWFIGMSGYLSHTSDAGKTWDIQNPNYTGTLLDIKMFDSNNGIIVGQKRAFIRTTDGGKNWNYTTLKYLADTTSNITGIYFIDSKIGFIIADKGTTGDYLLRTTDAGATWDSVLVSDSKTLLSISFGTPTNGVVVGKDVNTVYYSTDAGKTWTKGTGPSLSAVYTRSDLFSVSMVGENLAVATGWGTFAAGLQPAIFVKTTDGGKNWAYMDQTDANKFYYYFKGIYMKDATNGVAFGGSAAYFGGKIYKTTDGGTNWFQTLTNVPFEIQRIAVFPNKVYYLTNYSEVYSASDIFGTNLTPVIMPGIALSSICFPSANVGYASSTSAPAYIKTTDGGKTWLTKSILFPLTVPSLTKNRTINQLQFLNENVGFATCTGRNLHKTTNGGETWMPIIADTSVLSNFNCNASYFVNENLGWAVARYAGTSPNYNYAIYKTSDGGASWSQTTGAKELNAIHFTNTTTGVAVGKAGNIMYTTDAGNTWTAAICPTTSQFSGVKFITPTNVIAISDSGRIISSADAGKTWTLNTAAQTAYNAYNFNSIFVKDNQNIYICGYRSKPALRGTLIYSNDGGTTFSDLSDTATFQNNVVDFTIDPSGAWWAITPSSTIYSTKNLTGVEAISNVIPVNYELSQNYPNPFNPTTMISWKMMNRGKVELRIFDVLGKEVKSLVNETKDAGTYKVNWDGKNNNGKAVSTGIYYYMLKANNFVDVKKMMMLK